MEANSLKRSCISTNGLEQSRKRHLGIDSLQPEVDLRQDPKPVAAVDHRQDVIPIEGSDSIDPSTEVPRILTSSNYCVYRVRGKFSELTLAPLLEKYLGIGFQPLIESFATEQGDIRPKHQECVATVSFETKPQMFGNGFEERTFHPDDITIDSHFRGLTTLYCPEPSNHKFDIVSVCGLGGHALGSFKERHGKHIWLRDSLPEDFPHARIRIYGYNSRIFRSSSTQGLASLASCLKVALEPSESNPSLVKPIIFIAHSLGGLILKEAMIQCSHTEINFLRSTRGILFFGVPHQGMNMKTFLPMAHGQPNAVLLYSLQNNSELLERQNKEFVNIFNSQVVKVFCFYETRESLTAIQEAGTWKINGPEEILVSKASAISCLPSRTEGHEICGLNRSHSELVKFGRRDEDYLIVKKTIARVATSIEHPALTRDEWNDRLQELSFPQIDSRIDSIKAASSETCTWILSQPEYKSWLDMDKRAEHNGFLWIKGKPGAGKSTIMKYAYLNAKISLTGPKNIISFFFSARGTALEKSVEGMYRSLLFQILKSCALPRPNLLPKGSDNGSKWNLEVLQSALILSVQHLEDHLVIFIDALDECPEDDAREMVEFLEDLVRAAASQTRRLNICLSSRHYPHITIQKGLQLIMEEQTGHNQDIEKYLNSKFLAGKDSEPIRRVRKDVLSRASGVFLWVVLVLPMLKKAYDSGKVHALQKRLKQIPDRVDDLFSDILKRDNENTKGLLLCLQCLLFSGRPLHFKELYFAILAGNSPTDLARCHFMHITEDDMKKLILSHSKGFAEITTHNNVQFIHESVRDFFLLKNGFARIEIELSGDIKGLGHERLKEVCSNYIMADIYGDLQVTRSLPITSSSGVETEVWDLSNKLPLLEYAVDNLLYHSNEAQFYGTPQDAFLKIFNQGAVSMFRRWALTYNLSFSSLYYTRTVSLLYVLAEEDLEYLMPMVAGDPSDYMMVGDELYISPIIAAATCRSSAAFKSILSAYGGFTGPRGRMIFNEAACSKFKEDIHSLAQSDFLNTESGLVLLYDLLVYISQFSHEPERLFDIETLDTNSDRRLMLLIWAIGNDSEATIKRMLENQRIDLNAEFDGKTPLMLAIELGNEAIVKLLLSVDGIDLNFVCGLRTPLLSAIKSQNESMIKLLLSTDGIRPNLDCGGITPLLSAIEFRNKSTLKLLLSADGIDLNLECSGITPLISVIWSKDDAMLKLLLEAGDVDLNLDCDGLNPLFSAIYSQNEAMVKLFLSSGSIDPNMVCYGKSPLCSAIESENESMVKLLLSADGIDPNMPSGGLDSFTPLYLAVWKRKTTMVESLLAADGIDPNLKVRGATPLIRASLRGDRKIVMLLLMAEGIDPNIAASRGFLPTALLEKRSLASRSKILYPLSDSIDNEVSPEWDVLGWAPLHWAAYFGHTDIVELLLATGVEPDLRTQCGHTSLWLAVRNQQEQTTALLLATRGVDPNARTLSGWGPLHVAAAIGHEMIMKLLLATNGIDKNSTTDDGWTALKLATLEQHRVIVELLT